MELSDAHKHVLTALAEGIVLKGHRDIEGEKVYKLHAIDGSEIEEVAPDVMEFLKDYHLIHSNMKFPAASFLLTEKGRKIAEELVGHDISALGADNFVQE